MKKNVILPTLLILMATLVIAVFPTEAESAVYDDTIRLHILANSDSQEDQNLKLLIRDSILLEFSDELSSAEGTDDAKTIASGLLSKIEKFAEEKIIEEGYSYDVTATFDVEWYDTREYEDFILPKGYYTSLKIVIGEGEGKNWWCVMFPPLCLDMASEDTRSEITNDKYSKEETVLISKNGYKAKFKILEIVSDVFK